MANRLNTAITAREAAAGIAYRADWTEWAIAYGVLALDATTGAQQWFFPTNDSVAASPIVTPQLVVAPSKDGFLYAINRTTGNLLWKEALQAGVSSPALSGSTLVVAGGAFGGTGTVTGVSLDRGAVLWTFHPNGPVQGSVTIAGGLAYFATNVANGTVYAVDVATGAPVWSFTPPNSPTSTDFIFSSPVVADNLLLVAGDNGHVYAFGSPAGFPSGSPSPDYVPWAAGITVILVAAVAAAYVIHRRRSRAR